MLYLEETNKIRDNTYGIRDWTPVCETFTPDREGLFIRTKAGFFPILSNDKPGPSNRDCRCFINITVCIYGAK